MRTGDTRLWAYNAEDCCRTFEVDTKLQAVVDKMGLRQQHDFQQSLFYPVLRTMNRGVRVDEAARKALLVELQAAEAEAFAWLTEVVGHEINIKSPKQVADFFYNEMSQAPYHNRKTGSPTTDDAALDKIAAREPLLAPIVEKIAELRSLGVFTGTFLKSLTDEDGRLRCSFNIGGTVSFRFSSSENAFGGGMNLQNWSVGKQKKEGEKPPPNIRKVIIPDPGYTFFDIDLASADLRIVVWESDCKAMKEMFAAGIDPYTEIAKEFYGDPKITKSDPRRELFKRFAHATNYLGQARTIAPKIGLSVPSTERMQAKYFDKFPEIAHWQSNTKRDLTTTGRLRNVFGYSRQFFDRIEGTVYNEGVAWIAQSTVAILINHGYVNIHRNLPEVEVLLQVHDSLAGQFLEKSLKLKERIIEQCSIPLPYKDPLTIPVGIKTSSKSWGDCA